MKYRYGGEGEREYAEMRQAKFPVTLLTFFICLMSENI